MRAVLDDEQMWIVFADVCKILGYANPSDRAKCLQRDESKMLDVLLKNGLARCVNQRGLFRFCCRSNRDAR